MENDRDFFEVSVLHHHLCLHVLSMFVVTRCVQTVLSFHKKVFQQTNKQTNRNPSAGKVSIFGHNMSMESERVKAFDLLGVCPQVDPLWEPLAAKNLRQTGL